MNAIVSNPASVLNDATLRQIASLRGVAITPKFADAMNTFDSIIQDYVQMILTPVVNTSVIGCESYVPCHQKMALFDLYPSCGELGDIVGDDFSDDELAVLSCACASLVRDIDPLPNHYVRFKGNRELYEMLCDENKDCDSYYFFNGDHGIDDPRELENGSPEPSKPCIRGVW